jgi:uncharacterized protein (TIGR02145 family)
MAPFVMSAGQPTAGGLQFYSLVQDLNGLAAIGGVDVPNLALTQMSLVPGGAQTSGGNETLMLFFGSAPGVVNAPAVVITGGIHAWESPAPEIAYLLAEYLIVNYTTAPRNRFQRTIRSLVDSRRIYIIPMLNPDGNPFSVFTAGGAGRNWRKNRRTLPVTPLRLPGPGRRPAVHRLLPDQPGRADPHPDRRRRARRHDHQPAVPAHRAHRPMDHQPAHRHPEPAHPARLHHHPRQRHPPRPDGTDPAHSQVVPPQRKTYPVPLKPLAYDNTTVTVPAPPSSEAIFFTLQSFDGGGSYLNSQQFTAYAQVSYLEDVAGHVYPIALFGNTFWMLANYQFNAPGSYDYAGNPANEAAFGKLYDSQVLSQPPAGWQVPAVADWNALFGLFGDPKAAYAALIGGGRSGFKAALGGRRSIQPGGAGLFEQQYQYGYYWAAGNTCAQFSGNSLQASAGSPVSNPATALSVRFIRHA